MKKIRGFVCCLLSLILMAQTVMPVFAETKKNGKYISEVILSYGDDDASAKAWLTENGYEILDSNLNEGADDAIWLSKSRSVYLGYKTTDDASEAIRDMRVINMSGGYSTQDYQAMLKQQKENIQLFIDGFLATVKEYRENYAKDNQRAYSACKTLNMFYDDDTGMYMGDLLLNKIKEEYTEDEWNALGADEQKKHADMTTILMQADSEIVKTIEQTLAMAADTSDTPWINRIQGTNSYDDMVEALVESGVPADKAEKQLAAQYEATADQIAGIASEYKEFLSDYANSGISVYDDNETVNAYLSTLDNEGEQLVWYEKGAQYEVLKSTTLSDGTSLLDLLNQEAEAEDSTLVYPIAAVLSEGQKASVGFLTGEQFVTIGFTDGNDREAADGVLELDGEDYVVSIYNGIDRSIYSDDVALTGDAYKLQTSSENLNYADNWFTGGISTTTEVLGAAACSTSLAAIGSFILKYKYAGNYQQLINAANSAETAYKNALQNAVDLAEQRADAVQYLNGPNSYNIYATEAKKAAEAADLENAKALVSKLTKESNDAQTTAGQLKNAKIEAENALKSSSSKTWSTIFEYVGVGLTIASIILSAVTLWQTYEDLKDYYNASFTAIPAWMVDESADEKGASVFTYYKAAKCNRTEAGFVTDSTRILGDIGDLNGDVGKQWVALYTTKDSNVGTPITTDLLVQTGNSNIPTGYTALSMFDEDVAQNLTNEVAGYTYNNAKKGIYLFYKGETSTGLTLGSVFVHMNWISVVAIIEAIIILAGVILIVCISKKKAGKKKNPVSSNS